MSYTTILICAYWETRNKAPLLTVDVRRALIHHIRVNARERKIIIRKIGGDLDHLQCLMRLRADMSLSKAMQYIKGESSRWINQEKLIPGKFLWADGYYAESVGYPSRKRHRVPFHQAFG